MDWTLEELINLIYEQDEETIQELIKHLKEENHG